jgi:DNA repair exonuclease SbcCD ATPase subunit
MTERTILTRSARNSTPQNGDPATVATTTTTSHTSSTNKQKVTAQTKTQEEVLRLFAGIENEKDDLQQQLDESNDKALALKSEIKNCKAELNTLRKNSSKKLKNLSNTNDKLNNDIKMKDAIIEDQKRSVDTKTKEINIYLKDIEKLERELNKKNELLKYNEEIQSNKDTHIKFLENKFETEMTEQEKKIVDFKTKNDSLRKLLLTEKSNFEKEKIQLNTLNEELSKKVEETEQRVKDTMNAAIKQSYDDLHAERETFLKEKQILEGEKERMKVYKEKQINDLQNEKNKMEEKLREFEQNKMKFDQNVSMYDKNVRETVNQVLQDLDAKQKEKVQQWEWAINEKLKAYMELQRETNRLESIVASKKRKLHLVDGPDIGNYSANSSNDSDSTIIQRSNSSPGTATFQNNNSSKDLLNDGVKNKKSKIGIVFNNGQSGNDNKNSNIRTPIYSGTLSRNNSSNSHHGYNDSNGNMNKQSMPYDNNNFIHSNHHYRNFPAPGATPPHLNFSTTYAPSMSRMSSMATAGSRGMPNSPGWM